MSYLPEPIQEELVGVVAKWVERGRLREEDAQSVLNLLLTGAAISHQLTSQMVEQAAGEIPLQVDTAYFGSVYKRGR